MKKVLLFLALLLASSKSAEAIEINPQSDIEKQTAEIANSYITGERIENFNSNITILADGSVDIREEIIYYFDTERHGIYRYIPYTLQDNGKRYDMEFTFGDVIDENGKKYKYEVSNNGNDWVLKIGDPNRTVTGLHTYIISYSVKGALRYFDDHDELYWNVTGNGWDVPIKKAETTVLLPHNIKEAELKTACFTGSYGSDRSNCTGEITDGKTHLNTTGFISANEGLTIAVTFPKGNVAVLKPVEYVPFFDRWYGKLTLAGIILGGIFWYIFLPVYLVVKWFRYGRDPFAGIPVTASFDPPKTGKRNLTPAETGSLLDEHVEKRDLFSTIIDLAFRGHLKISEPKNNEFHLVKNASTKKDVLLPFEQALYDGIFEDGNDVELKKVKFYTTAIKVEGMIYKILVEHKYFVNNPKTTRSLYYALGGLAIPTLNLVLAFIAFLFGRHMPAKTLLGSQTAAKAQGLKNFLQSQERQLNYQGDKQMLFEKLLSYAVAFGVEKQWAKRFEKFDLKNPDWYEGTSMTHFNTALFASHLSHSYSNFAVSSTPPSSSSSSGFSGGSSGGGGGGGGGGSW